MLNYFTESSEIIYDEGLTVIKLMRDKDNNPLPMYEFHMKGVTDREWVNFYLFNCSSSDTFWIIGHIQNLHSLVEFIDKVSCSYIANNELEKTWKNIYTAYHNRYYSYELLPESERNGKFCIERFPDFNCPKHRSYWNVACICNIGKPLTLDFIEKLTEYEVEMIRTKAWELYGECERMWYELNKIQLSPDSQNIIYKEITQYSRKTKLVTSLIALPIKLLIGNLLYDIFNSDYDNYEYLQNSHDYDNSAVAEEFNDSECFLSNENETTSITFGKNTTPTFKTGNEVKIICDTGTDKGNYEVYSKNGDKYIKFGTGSNSNWNNWIKIEDKKRFFWNGNWYTIKK